MTIDPMKIWLYVCFTVYLAVLIWLLFFFPYTHASRTNAEIVRTHNLVPFKNILDFVVTAWESRRENEIREAVLNIGGNLLLLIPLGLFIQCLLKQPYYKTTLWVCTISISIETLQLISQTGTFDLDDILLNTLGALIVGSFAKVQHVSKAGN
jgi:glycopeptide antibiotics resistance protein